MSMGWLEGKEAHSEVGCHAFTRKNLIAGGSGQPDRFCHSVRACTRLFREGGLWLVIASLVSDAPGNDISTIPSPRKTFLGHSTLSKHFSPY